MNAAVVFFLIFGCITSCNAAVSGFDYENQTAWQYLPNSNCGSTRRQSPIDIISADASANDNLTSLRISGYNVAVDGTVNNTLGRTLSFLPAAGTTQTLTTYRGVYDLLQMHFHWGNVTGEGSEHLLNGVQYEAEAHFVHTKRGGTPTDGDYYAVLGILLRVNDTAPVAGTIWSKFSIPPFNQGVAKTGVVFQELLPGRLDYFHYEGSLTTPTCDETVNWYVLQYSIDIPSTTLEAFRTLQANEAGDEELVENFRDVQPVGRRQVYRYNSAQGVMPMASVLLMVIATVLLSVAF